MPAFTSRSLLDVPCPQGVQYNVETAARTTAIRLPTSPSQQGRPTAHTGQISRPRQAAMTLIEDLLEMEIPQLVKLSGDGQQIVYSTTVLYGHKKGEHAISTVWLGETGKPKSARQLTSGIYNDREPRWSPDDKTVAFLSDRAKQSESCALYLISTRGGEAFPVTTADNERGIDRYEFSPDGKFIAFLSADEKSPEKKAKDKDKDDAQVWGEDWPFARLRIVHVATKKSTTLVSKDAHIADLAWSDDGSKIAFTEHRNPGIESGYLHGSTISVIEVASHNAKPVLTFPRNSRQLIWSSNKLYFLGGATADKVITSSAVYSIALDAEKMRFERCAHGEIDCAMAISKAGSDVVVKVESKMEDQIRILNGRTIYSKQKAISAWDAAFTRDSDEIVLAITTSDVNTPDEVYTTLSSGGAMVQLSNHGHVFADKKSGTCTFLSCQSLDEKDEIDGLYLTPHEHTKEDGTPKEHLPTAVLIHGGPYSRNTDAFNTLYYMWTPLLLAAGYGVLLPNYRGGSGRGEHYAQYARGRLGEYDYSDVIALTQHGVEKGYADKDRLLVGGWSQGGFISFLSAMRNGMHDFGWKFKAAIPGAGVSDWDSMALTSDVAVLEVELAGAGPWSTDKDDISNRRASSIFEMKKAAEAGAIPPMLILHGEKDERVPITQAWGIRRGLEHYGLRYEFVTYPREGHFFRERKHLVDLLERLQRFCDTILS